MNNKINSRMSDDQIIAHQYVKKLFSEPFAITVNGKKMTIYPKSWNKSMKDDYAKNGYSKSFGVKDEKEYNKVSFQSVNKPRPEDLTIEEFKKLYIK